MINEEDSRRSVRYIEYLQYNQDLHCLCICVLSLSIIGRNNILVLLIMFDICLTTQKRRDTLQTKNKIAVFCLTSIKDYCEISFTPYELRLFFDLRNRLLGKYLSVILAFQTNVGRANQ